MSQTIRGEVVKDLTQEKKVMTISLREIHQALIELINMVHLMPGPVRLEIADAVVETRSASGYDVPVTAGFFIGDIEAACKVLTERLKG